MKSARQSTGEADHRALSIGKYAPSNSILVPPANPPLERGIVAQTLIDIAFVLFVSVTSLAIAGGLFILLFVKT